MSPWLLGAYHSHATWPSWKPDVHPTYTPESLKAHLQKRSGIPPPDSGSEFCSYHADLNPANIFVQIPEDGAQRARISAIIDWDDAGYWPHYWIITCPKVNHWFLVPGENESAWRDELCSQLQLQLSEADLGDESSWYRKK